MEIFIEADELDLVPSDPDAEPQPTIGKFVERCRLFCYQYGLTLRKNEHAGSKANLGSTSGQKPEKYKWIVISILCRADAPVIGIERSGPLGRGCEQALAWSWIGS